MYIFKYVYLHGTPSTLIHQHPPPHVTPSMLVMSLKRTTRWCFVVLKVRRFQLGQAAVALTCIRRTHVDRSNVRGCISLDPYLFLVCWHQVWRAIFLFCFLNTITGFFLQPSPFCIWLCVFFSVQRRQLNRIEFDFEDLVVRFGFSLILPNLSMSCQLYKK